MTGPEFVDALKALNATWSEAIALLSGPATASGVSPAWAKAAEAQRVHGYFLDQFPVKDRIHMGYIYIYPRYPRPSQDGIYSWNIDI